MDVTYLIALLFLVTLSSVLIFAIVSKTSTEQRMEKANKPKSSLAKDAKQ